MKSEAKPGQELYSVATGNLNFFIKASRGAVKYMNGLEGFMGVHIALNNADTLWMFDTLNHAKEARNLAQAQGIQCGTNICRFVVAADGVPVADEEWVRTNGERKGL